MFSKYIEFVVRPQTYDLSSTFTHYDVATMAETALVMVPHPRVVKEIFYDGTAMFDYNLYVRVDDVELRGLEPGVSYDGHYLTFYFHDIANIKIGSRVEISLVFWYKEKIIRDFNGSTNIRRDEMSQATEHWTYMEDDQFHIDPEDVDIENFMKMLRPEWRNKNSHVVESTYEEDSIIDVDFTEVESEEEKCSQEKIKQIETHT
jgi:hypothetical protein